MDSKLLYLLVTIMAIGHNNDNFGGSGARAEFFWENELIQKLQRFASISSTWSQLHFGEAIFDFTSDLRKVQTWRFFKIFELCNLKNTVPSAAVW